MSKSKAITKEEQAELISINMIKFYAWVNEVELKIRMNK